MHDLRLALRILRKNPGFTLIAILTLALGIGANTAIFTVANALLLRALPYQHPDRLILISGADFNRGGSWGRLSFPFYRHVEEHSRSFDQVAASIYDMFTLTGFGDPEQVTAARASASFFDVLGVRPMFGRTFLPEEDSPGGANVALLRYQFATRLFGNDAKNAVGKTITLDSRDYTIVGVLPPGFEFSLFGAPRDLWTPRVFEMNFITPARVAAGGAYFNLIGRLRRGVSREQATAELQVLYQQYRHDQPGNYDATLNLTMGARDLQSELVSDVRPTLLMLSAAVGLVLLIACANVASLVLSRALGRRKEFSIRAALGASRAALMRQVLTESVLMAVAGGALGIGLGYAGTRLLVSLNKDAIESADLSIDPRVLAFTLAISVLSGVLFGLAPSLQISRTDVNAALRDEARGSTGSRRRNRARSVLVIVQVALSMVLLIGSGLLIRSFVRLRNAPLGFEPKNVLSMQIMLAPAKYGQAPPAVAFYRNVLAHVENIAGTEAASLSTALPVSPTHGTPVLFEGQPAVVLGQRPIANLQQISPDYEKVMRIPIVAGRAFNDHDDVSSPPVAMVNQTVVRRFWPTENPIGKRVWIGNVPAPYEVVGVMGDTRNNGPAQATAPEVFLPYPQMTFPMLQVSVRSAGDPHSMVSAVRHAIAEVDKDQSVTEVRTMEETLESLDAQPRFLMFLLGVFSAVAFVLAIVGIYGVIGYMVAQRTQELGIRIALGAAKQDILKLVIGSGLALAAAGISIGLLASLALTRLMASLLYQTSATDPVTLLASVALFTVVAAAASYVPARCATRIDPIEVLRAE
jgi:putative ABC transport system permease protein